VARVAMELKEQLVKPTPRNVRIRLPRLTINPKTGGRMSDTLIQNIFATKCYDAHPDDPWQYLPCISQDVLPTALKPLRVDKAKHILSVTDARSWYSHVAFDPCYSLLAKTLQRSEEQKVAALGKLRWMSKKSRRAGHNPRAPATANSQKGSDVTRVDWTPIFARGKVRIYVVDSAAALLDNSLPKQLADSKNLSLFVTNVLEKELQHMKNKYGWRDIPRVVVHDKAPYMVTAMHERLQVGFAGALQDAGFRSWAGDITSSTKWMVRKFGDVYLHETLISHIRRLLNTNFAATRLDETPVQFRARMQKVEDYLNSAAFAQPGGSGLDGLARELRERCEEVIKRKGERLPK
jgi:hypothetical protein